MTGLAATQTLPDRAPKTGELGTGALATVAGGDGGAAADPGQSTLVRLACADDDAQRQELAVFWDHE